MRAEGCSVSDWVSGKLQGRGREEDKDFGAEEQGRCMDLKALREIGNAGSPCWCGHSADCMSDS